MREEIHEQIDQEKLNIQLTHRYNNQSTNQSIIEMAQDAWTKFRSLTTQQRIMEDYNVV